MSRTFQIHPRGFIGAVSPDASTQALAHINTTRLAFGSFQHRERVVFPHNRKVAEVYDQFQFDHLTRNAFQFYEQVLSVALTSFGTEDFVEWCSAQAQATSTDYLHARFIKDTVRFIFTGKREMMLEQWLQLLSNNREISGTRDDLPKSEDAFRQTLVYLDERLKESSGYSFSENKSLSKEKSLINILFNWVKQPGGITDLLKTIHILFGK